MDLTTPNGGEDWSGGSSHAIRWNMSDAETATTSLKVWINYSSDGGATYGPISGAQGLSGLSNPCTFAWTVPASTTVQARVKVTVLDTQGAPASDSSVANFAIDATAPTVTALSPPDGSTGVSTATQVSVSFSETMNKSSAEQAFSLTRVDTGSPVAGTSLWSGNNLLFTPSSALAEGVVYRTQVAATAKDASDPGNPLGTSSSATFTTVDLTPPTISSVSAVPSPQQAGGRVNVSAAVSDNGVVAGVWIEIRDPGSALVGNFTAAYDAGSGRSFYDAAYAHPGTYGFRISARDAAGNWNVSVGTFAVVDTVPPTIQHVPVTQAVKDMPIQITAAITDVDAVMDARVNYADVLGARYNVSMILNGSLYQFSVPGQPQFGTLTYFLWARDPSGNAARTPSYAVTVVGADTTPPSISNLAAVPPVQNATQSVNISASVSDNVAVQNVNVLVTDPQGQALGNFSMVRLGATDTYYHDRTYSGLGTYTLVVWAVDGSNNAASAGESFRIVDLVPPVFQAVSVSPSVAEAGQSINISASVTDNVAVSEVRITLRGPTGNVVLDQALAGSSSFYWINATPKVLGNLSFLLTAMDVAGNVATYRGNVSVVDTQPPVAVAGADMTVWIGSSVTFNASSSRDNSGIVNFTWSFVYNGTDVLLYGAVSNFTFNTVGRYNVTLTVVDAAGLAGTSVLRVSVITDTTPPPAPRNLVILSVAPACLKVTWEPSAALDLAGYRLYRWNRTRASFDLIANLPADATTYTDCGLEDDTVYSYW
ncbi:MAG: Ig-like domain-containing protein, partial [Candidatus Thermoplasmatota archaeon]